MKKYRVLVSWEGVKIGELLKNCGADEFVYKHNGNIGFISPVEIALLLHAGMIEEVKEEDGKWVPKIGEMYFCFDWEGVHSFTWDDHPYDHQYQNALGVYRTEKEAREMFEYLKKCVRDKREGV